MPKSKNPDDESALKLARETKEELAKYRKQFEKDWCEYEDAYYGKQHKTGESHKTVKNHLFKIVEGEVPILTDSMPGTTILSEQEDRQDDALVLEKAIRFVYHDQNLQLTLPSLARSFLISAPGYLYTFYDPDADGGEGKIRYKKLPWKSVFLDGNASLIEDAQKAVIEIPMRRGEISRIFPEKKEDIEDQSLEESQDAKGDDEENYESRDVSGRKSSQGKPKDFKGKDVLSYRETWVMSYDLEKIPGEDTEEELTKEREQLQQGIAPDIYKWENHDAHIQDHAQVNAQAKQMLGLPPEATFEQCQMQVEQLLSMNPEFDPGPALLIIKLSENHILEHVELKKLNPTSERPKYKDGWRVIKTVGQVLLYDGPNPNQPSYEKQKIKKGEIPLVPFYCYKDDTIYGFGEIKNIIDPQRTLNEVDYKEFKGLKRNANSGWIADHESGVTPEKLTNDEGIVVIKAKGTEVRRLEPGAISPQLQQRREADIYSMEDISGINEATQGVSPSASASGAAIRSLQGQAIGRVRLKDRYLQHYSMKRLARLTANLILCNWSTEKRLRFNTDSSGVQELVFDPLRMSDLGYSVEISPGSMAGIDKEALNGLYLNLFQLSGGQMQFEDLLSVMDIPKKEVLLKKLEERKTQQAELEQVQMQDQQVQQAAQVDSEFSKLQKENIKLKARISPDLLTREEQSLYEIFVRQDAISALTGTAEATNGQSA